MPANGQLEPFEVDAFQLGRQLIRPRTVRRAEIVRKEVRMVNGEPHLIEEHIFIEEEIN